MNNFKILQPNHSLVGLFLIMFSLIACSETKRGIEISDWLEEKEISDKILNNLENLSCDSLDFLFNQLKLKEFQRRTVLAISRRCSKTKEKNIQYNLLAIDLGIHLSRIDSTLYPEEWQSYKNKYLEKNHGFWEKIDTSYFTEIENLVKHDQEVRNNRPNGSSDFFNELKADSISTNYLLNFCNKNGFPMKFDPIFFPDFRTTVNPLILAVHANEKNKIQLLSCAIVSATEGTISWSMPINICKSFHIVRVEEDAVKPLRFLKFDDKNKIDVPKSILQLYSLGELYIQDIPRKIIVQPAKSNILSTSLNIENMQIIKSYLLETFSVSKEKIEIVDSPNCSETESQEISPYLYTFTNQYL